MIIQWKWQIQGIRFDKQSAWKAMDKGLWFFRDSVQNHPQEKEMQKGKLIVWGGLKNSWEEKQKAKE